jgi:glycosyltransferase involved in cell wall biosynthesis
MELIDFTKNENSIIKHSMIESVLLFGDPNNVSDAQITICIPTYKRPRLLKESIESAIKQVTNIPYLIIVVDNDSDFSNTDVLELIKSFNQRNLIYYKNKENLEMCGNWNRCVVLAKTKWVAFLHDDDLLLENYIEEISAVLSKHGKKIKGLCVRIIYLNYPYKAQVNKKNRLLTSYLKRIFLIFQSKNKGLIQIPFSVNLFSIFYGPPSCGMIFNRKCFLESGGFNQDYYPGSPDNLFFIFFTKKYNFFRLKKVLAIYRWEVNTYLRKDVQLAVRDSRNKQILSIKNSNILSKFLFCIFKKDFTTLMKVEELSSTILKLSIPFKIIYILYDLFLNMRVIYKDDL